MKFSILHHILAIVVYLGAPGWVFVLAQNSSFAGLEDNATSSGSRNTLSFAPFNRGRFRFSGSYDESVTLNNQRSSQELVDRTARSTFPSSGISRGASVPAGARCVLYDGVRSEIKVEIEWVGQAVQRSWTWGDSLDAVRIFSSTLPPVPYTSHPIFISVAMPGVCLMRFAVIQTQVDISHVGMDYVAWGGYVYPDRKLPGADVKAAIATIQSELVRRGLNTVVDETETYQEPIRGGRVQVDLDFHDKGLVPWPHFTHANVHSILTTFQKGIPYWGTTPELSGVLYIQDGLSRNLFVAKFAFLERSYIGMNLLNVTTADDNIDDSTDIPTA